MLHRRPRSGRMMGGIGLIASVAVVYFLCATFLIARKQPPFRQKPRQTSSPSSALSNPETNLLTAVTPFVAGQAVTPFVADSLTVVIPFVAGQAEMVRALWSAWERHPPCSAGQPPVRLVLYLDHANALLGQFLQAWWREEVSAGIKGCFDRGSPYVTDAGIGPAVGYPRGPCQMFYRMFDNSLLNQTKYLQLLEPDLLPIQPLWLDRLQDETVHGKFWMKGSAARCPFNNELARRRDYHINGNSLYCVGCPEFREFRDRVVKYYSPDGCDTGGLYENGYDHAMYQYRQRPEHFQESLRWLSKFVYTDVIQNLCHLPYNATDLLPATFLVHSKWPTLSRFDQVIHDFWWRWFQQTTVPQPEYRAVHSRIQLREWSVDRLADDLCLHMFPAHPSCKEETHLVKKTGQVRVWSVDFGGEGVMCNVGLFGEDVEVHLEVDDPSCMTYGVCRDRLKVLHHAGGQGVSLDPCPHRLRRRFYEAYRNDPEFSNVDAFFCSYPAANCELFMPFGKPLILYVTTPLEFGRSGQKHRWEEWLHLLHKILQNNPGSVLIANGHYYANYAFYFTGIRPAVLPSWCGGDTRPYLPSVSNLIPVFGSSPDECRGINFFVAGGEGGLERYRMVVVVPTEPAGTRLTQLYRQEIPLFAPSPSFLKVLLPPNGNDTRMGMGPRQVVHLLDPSGRWDALNMPKPSHDDPFWIELYDVYQWPHVQFFQSWHELCTLLQNINDQELLAISRKMREYNRALKKHLKQQWASVFQPIREAPHPKLNPADPLEQRLRNLYGSDVWPIHPDPNSCLSPHPAQHTLFSSLQTFRFI